MALQVIEYSKNGDEGPWLRMEKYGSGWAIPNSLDAQGKARDYSYRVVEVTVPKVEDNFTVRGTNGRRVTYHVLRFLSNIDHTGPYVSYLVKLITTNGSGVITGEHHAVFVEGDLLNAAARAVEYNSAN
jgi:hypothetical protein